MREDFIYAKKNDDKGGNQSRKRYTKQNLTCGGVYGLPEFLFEPEFDALTNDARILYALLYDVQKRSLKNKWYDENGDVYIFCKREAMQQMLRLSDRTITKIINSLKDFSLLEEVRQGWTKPNKIYLLYPVKPDGTPINTLTRKIYESDPKELRIMTRKNYESRPEETTIHEPKDLRFSSQIGYVPDPNNLRIKTRKNYESRPEEITIQKEVKAHIIPEEITNQDPKELRIKTRKNYESRTEKTTVHDPKDLRNRDGIFKIRDNDQKPASNIVQVVLKNYSVISIEKDAVIAVRIWEEERKHHATLFTKDMNYELKQLTHYEAVELFGEKDFFICNREYVVNSHYVDEVNYHDCELKLINGLRLEFKPYKVKTIRQYCKGV